MEVVGKLPPQRLGDEGGRVAGQGEAFTSAASGFHRPTSWGPGSTPQGEIFHQPVTLRGMRCSLIH